MRGRIVELAVISLFLVACSATPAASVPDVTPTTEIVVTQATTEAPVATEVATAMPEATTATQVVLPMSTPIPLDAPDATALVATTVAQMPPTITPDPSGMSAGVDAIAVLALASNATGQFFATTVTNMIENFDKPHPVTIYQKQGTKFVKITQYDFTNSQNITGMELFPNPDTSHMLVLVHGVINPHSVYDTVLAFDGKTLTPVLETHSDAGRSAMTVIDFNGDGINDVLVNDTDYLLFCQDCGVQMYKAHVTTWDGTKFVDQKLTASSDATIQKAIDYANAQRWNMVTSLLPTIATPTTDSDKWNVALLTHMAKMHTPNKDSAFPLMDAILYGDYDGAVKMLQAVGAKEVAKPKGKWFAGTFTQGVDFASAITQGGDVATDDPSFDNFRKLMFDTIVQSSTLALTQDNTVTSARFLRGWAKTMVDPKDAEGLKDLEAVASADPFYAAVRDAIVSR